MKKIFCVLAVFCAAGLIIGCSSLKKAKDKVSVSDVKKVADLVDMDFGSGPNGPFQVSKATTKNSLLVIQNDTDRIITVKAVGPTKKTFEVKSGESSKAEVKPGKYHFAASAPNAKGCEGDAKLSGYKEYKWVFTIKK